MKRAIGIIFAVVMIIVSVQASFAANIYDISDETRINAELLNALDIADIDIGNTVMNEGISQKQFLSMIIRSIFDDFDTDNDIELQQTAEALGIIKDKEYNQGKLLTYTGAYNMALNALGYNVFQDYTDAGFSPDIKVRRNLSKGIEGKGNYITAEEAIQLICNMIEENVIYVHEISAQYKIVRTTRNETILSYYRNISKIEGVVIDNGISSIYGETQIDSDWLMIGDNYISCRPEQAREYLGMNVAAYTKTDIYSDERLLYIYPKDNKLLHIDGDDIEKADFSNIRYDSGTGKIKKAVLNKNAKIIYNGEAYAAFEETDFSLKNGFIDLVDNDNSGNYDIIKITEYKTMVVRYISSQERLIISEFENDYALHEIELDSVNTNHYHIIKNGTEIKFSDIKSGDVLSVAQSKSGRTANIYVSDMSFEGCVQSIDESDRSFGIDGTVYTYTQEFERISAHDEPYASWPLFDTNYMFKLDFTGKIASVKLMEGSPTMYGYATKITKLGDCDDEFEGIRIKLFDQNGDWVKYDFREKVRLNGKSGFTFEKIYKELGGTFEPQLIQYKLDEDNKIKAINIAVNTSDMGYDGFCRRPEEELTYISQSTSFSNTIFIDSNSYMWFIPEDKSLEDLYFVGSTSNLTADAKYTFSAYNVDNSGSSGYFTVNLTQTDFEGQSLMFVLVTNVGKKLNSDGEVSDYIRCYIDTYSNEEIILGEDVDASGIKAGDILRVYLSPAGVLEKAVKIWSADDVDMVSIPDVKTLRSTRAIGVMGEINSVYPEKNIIVLNNGAAVQPLRMRSAGRILIYHKNCNIAEDASLSQLLPGDYAVMLSRYSSIYNAVIIRD